MKQSITILCLLVFSLLAIQVWPEKKSLIGETAWIQIDGIPFPYLARIDTGARTTSMHAVNIRISDESSVPRENIGKRISFQTMNRKGKAHTITAAIVNVSTITNSQGTEQRYEIELPLSWKKVKKTIQVNLRDRSRMTYKLLIGRNWLSGDFLVDVDMKADDKEVTL